MTDSTPTVGNVTPITTARPRHAERGVAIVAGLRQYRVNMPDAASHLTITCEELDVLLAAADERDALKAALAAEILERRPWSVSGPSPLEELARLRKLEAALAATAPRTSRRLAALSAPPECSCAHPLPVRKFGAGHAICQRCWVRIAASADEAEARS